jgi:hypothetical protein
VQLRHCQTPSIQQSHFIPDPPPNFLKKNPETFRNYGLKSSTSSLPVFPFLIYRLRQNQTRETETPKLSSEETPETQNREKNEPSLQGGDGGGEAGIH